MQEFLRRCLAKIGEGLEPVAEANMPYGRLDWLIGTSITVEMMYDLSLKKAKLYATPHEAIIAAEQRVAEACAKYVNRFISGDGILNEVWISEIEEAIRSGEWRKYIKE